MSGYFSDARSGFLPIFSIVSTLAVALRIWARRIKRLRLESNDYLIILGLAFALVEAIANIYGTPSLHTLETLGGHLGTLEAKDQGADIKELQEASTLFFKLTFLSQILWAIAVAFIRSSVILLYIRIFPTPSMRLTCYVVLVLNGAFSIGFIIADSLMCIPIACVWDKRTPCTSCGNVFLFRVLNASINLALDVTVVSLPTPVLWGLQMAMNKKIILSGMFGLGIVICAITAYRLHETNEKIAAELGAIDFLMCLEVILGVLNACLPVLRPVFDKLGDWKKSFSRSDSSNTSSKFRNISNGSQTWQSRSKKRAGSEELDSVTGIEDRRRRRDCDQARTGPKMGVRIQETEIHVQRDIRVESAMRKG